MGGTPAGAGRGGGGGTASGGGGAAGAAPYVPGENDRLPWATASLDRAIHQEEGSTRPILVFIYNASMNEDCCAANFERAIFMYKPIVELAKKFKCSKVSSLNPDLAKRFELNPKKPAILLLDAEGGLISKVQHCQDPKAYQKIVKQAYSLNAKRVSLKEKFLAMRRDALGHIEGKDYAKAVKALDRMLKQRDYLTGDLIALVESDRAGVDAIAADLLSEADQLRGSDKLLEAYDLYKEISKQFARINEAGKKAGICARQVKHELHDAGVTLK